MSRKIPLTQGQFAIVDDEDYELISQHKWHASWSKTTHTFYARRNVQGENGKRTTLRMHTFLMGGMADHRNGDTLDNRRENLRLATSSQNGANKSKQRTNTSGYKGVSWHKRLGRWAAKIKKDGKDRHIGYFDTPEEAARAYDKVAVELNGEFARTNFGEKASSAPEVPGPVPVWERKLSQNYGARTSRVRIQRGPASAFPCVRCGKQGGAWHQRQGTTGEDILDYDAVCLSCLRQEGTRRGTGCHNAKFTEDDIRAIRASDRPVKELAEAYGTSPTNIRYIIARKTWKHVK